jgi:hypothetical protein
VPTLGEKPQRLLSGDVGYIVPSPNGVSLFYSRNDNTGILSRGQEVIEYRDRWMRNEEVEEGGEG